MRIRSVLIAAVAVMGVLLANGIAQAGPAADAIAALETRVDQLEARVTALEEAWPSPSPTAPTPTPAPTAIPAPTATPSPSSTQTTAPSTCPADLQTALNGGGTLNLTGCSYSGGWRITHPVTITGGTFTASASTRVFLVQADNVTIDGANIGGGKDGIWAESPTNLAVVNSRVHDTVYSGITYLSAVGGLIENNLVERVGVGKPDGTNAYGILLDNYTPGGTTYPPCQDVMVRGNTVTDVPTWHAYDTHAGQRITFDGNIALRSSRAFFITTDSNGVRPQGVTLTGNLAGDPSPVTYNLVPITLYNTIGTTVTGNAISAGYAFFGDGVYDYAVLSTSLTVSGNYVGETLP